MIKVFLFLLLLIYIIKFCYIKKLRRKRDEIDLTTLKGKLQVKKINQTINLLNGYLMWNSLLRKK